MIKQRPADATPTKRRFDRQRSQQERLGIADADRQLPYRSYQQCPDPGRKREIEQMIDMLADSIRAKHEAAWPESALVQPRDRLCIVGGFGQNGEREIVHVRARDSTKLRRGPSPQVTTGRAIQPAWPGGWDR